MLNDLAVRDEMYGDARGIIADHRVRDRLHALFRSTADAVGQEKVAVFAGKFDRKKDISWAGADDGDTARVRLNCVGHLFGDSQFGIRTIRLTLMRPHDSRVKEFPEKPCRPLS